MRRCYWARFLMKHRFTSLVATSFLLAGPWANSAFAQSVDESTEAVTDVPASATEDAPPAEVQALLTDAVSEYDAARYREAQALFQRAHALAPSARTLRGVGMASFEVGQYVVALRALRQALAEQSRPLSDAQRRHVEALVARTEVFVATLIIDSEGNAPFLIDGEPASMEPDGTVLLDPGRHVVTVLDARGQSQTLQVTLVGGTQRTLIVRPSAVATGPNEVTAVGVSLLALGALTAVAAIATGSLALDHQAQVAQACSGFTCPGSVIPIRDRARDLSIATDVLGTSAAVSASAGLVMVLVQALTGSTAVHLDASHEHAFIRVEGQF